MNKFLELMVEIDTCILEVLAVAPHIGNAIQIHTRPKDVRDLALFLVEKCVSGLGTGGFASLNFANLVDWALDPRTYVLGPIPPDAVFLTISIRSRTAEANPGLFDPEVALALWGASNIAAALSPKDSPEEKIASSRADHWLVRANRMTRGTSIVSWCLQDNKIPPSDVDEMTYECDANLGNPAVADCAQIEWSQLGHPSDSLTVGPEATFLHFNTCTLAISGAITMVLVWQQIQTALAMLMNTCVQYPYLPPRGGRAYYNPKLAHVNRVKKKRQTNISGLNALPLHANITIFEQREGWTSTSGELNSCTWKAAQEGHSVKPCNPK